VKHQSFQKIRSKEEFVKEYISTSYICQPTVGTGDRNVVIQDE